MQNRKLNIPAFRDDSVRVDGSSVSGTDTDGMFNSVTVVRWGKVGGFTFRAGDRLILDPNAGTDSLLLLRPRGYGWPMLGRLRAGVLYAEPGGVRAAPARWRVSASVVGVERRLGRSVTDHGNWQVVVAPRGGSCVSDLEAAGLVGGAMDSRTVDALCHRAARWMEAGMGAEAIGVAPTLAEAEALAEQCPAGRLRIAPSVRASEHGQTNTGASVVVGPWIPRTQTPDRVAPATDRVSPATDRDGMRYDTPVRVPSRAESTAQLPLFRRLRSDRAC